MRQPISSYNLLRLLGIVCLAALSSGCAAITNPIANGVPARLLPPELLAESKDEFEQVPLDWLKVAKPEVYKLDTGDIIGVYIEGALGERDQLPPINFPQVADLPPSVGFPIPVGEEGNVPLPLVDKVHVAGLTVEEAQEAILRAYTGVDGGKSFLREEEARILVTLVRARQARILVIREDAPNQRQSLNDPSYRLFGSSPSLGQRLPGSGTILEVAEVEADVLTALARSGGLPGPNAENEIVIYRGTGMPDGIAPPNDWNPGAGVGEDVEIKRIPLRIRPGSERKLTEADVRLKSGDIIFVPPREIDVYYTGGLLPAREVPLPRDNDLRVVEAMLRVGGSVVNGGRFIGSFSGTASFTSGIESSSPSLLSVVRRAPNGSQVTIRVDLNRALRDPRENLLVMPGDVLILQETPAEAVSRYFSTVFNFGIFSEVFSRGSAAGQASLTLP